VRDLHRSCRRFKPVASNRPSGTLKETGTNCLESGGRPLRDRARNQAPDLGFSPIQDHEHHSADNSEYAENRR
jgi:hypothetical protein